MSTLVSIIAVIIVLLLVAGVGGLIGGQFVAWHRDEGSSDFLHEWERFVEELSHPDRKQALELAGQTARDIHQALIDIRVLGWSSLVLAAVLTSIGLVVGLAGPSMTTWITTNPWPIGAPDWLPAEPLRVVVVSSAVLLVVLSGGLLAAGPVDWLIRHIHR